MGGGLMQLQFIGKESDYFIGNPQISFFKTLHKRYGNFGRELIDLYFESQPNFNKSTYCNIPIHGELINEMYISLNLKVMANNLFTVTYSNLLFTTTEECVFYEDIYNSTNKHLYFFNYNYKIYFNSNAEAKSFQVKYNTITTTTDLYVPPTNTTDKFGIVDLSVVTNKSVQYTFDKNATIPVWNTLYIRFIKEDLTKIIKTISFEIDEYLIDVHNTNYLLFYNKLFVTSDTKNKLGNELKYITPSKFNMDIQIYIPLRFWFTKSPTSALPICALSNSDVNVKVLFNSMENVFMTHKIITNVQFNRCYLSTNYIFLDELEKK